MSEKREHLIAGVCLSSGTEDEVLRSIPLRLAALDLAEEQRASLAAHAQRLVLYRRLVRGNFETAARRLLPRTAACLDDAADNAFGRELDAFLAEGGMRSHYLRDLGPELVRWGTGRWASPAFPAHLADVARYEALEFAVGIAPSAVVPQVAAELALDRGAVFEPTAHLAHFAHTVHEEDQPATARPVALLVFRDAEQLVHTREIALAVAPVLERLLAGETLGQAVRGGAEGVVDDALLAQVAGVLAELASEGILLGARSS
ncbi:MAG TPA: hypothetical protein VNO21_08875 [Polyangiaceae bacterium]|nr:hypothetical protein [Polyangiaceae bacterium]